MFSKCYSASLLGVDAHIVSVELFCGRGLPSESIVGLPDTVIRESKNRVKTALIQSGFEYPLKAYTINLAPADLKKEGAYFDLAIALGMLHITGQVTVSEAFLAVGELSLDGYVRPVRGILSICHQAKQKGFKQILVPSENAPEACLIEGIDVVPVSDLKMAVRFFCHGDRPSNPPVVDWEVDYDGEDYKDVQGQETVKRAIEVAVAGHHNILMIGPPGSGKSMMAKRMPSILPLLDIDAAIESLRIHTTLAVHQHVKRFSLAPPFRSPHHSISAVGLVGGGHRPSPGELSLAHRGVLLLDEFPEFSRQALEMLRQPLEDYSVTVSRANYTVTYPTQFMLVATMNPCLCGYSTDPERACTCTDHMIKQYWKKLSGPILDRFDMVVHVPRLDRSDWFESASPSNSFQSSLMRDRISACRRVQDLRQQNGWNAYLLPNQIRSFCQLNQPAETLLADCMARYQWSGRVVHRILKVARTIADLNASDSVLESHLCEAFHFRQERRV